MATRADTHIDRPSTVEPGDAPADTTDPDERVTSVNPDKAAAAAKGHQTVNAAVPVKPQRQAAATAAARTETFEATRPDGSTVKVTRNIDTGESKTG